MTQYVLISGCSTGIGLHLATSLKARGYEVIASCRKQQDVERLRALGLFVLQLDVNDSDSIKSAVTKLLAHTGGRLDVLINNAGYGQVGALEDVDRQVIMAQFQTNVFGLLELTQAVIPIMRQQGKGRIINISSILGAISLPFRGAYNASKYAVEGVSDTLRMELEPSGIWVSSILPGAIESKFRDSAVDTSLRAIDIENSHFSPQYKIMLRTFKEKKQKSKLTLGPDAVFKKVTHAIESKRPKAKYAVTTGRPFTFNCQTTTASKMVTSDFMQNFKTRVILTLS